MSVTDQRLHDAEVEADSRLLAQCNSRSARSACADRERPCSIIELTCITASSAASSRRRPPAVTRSARARPVRAPPASSTKPAARSPLSRSCSDWRVTKHNRPNSAAEALGLSASARNTAYWAGGGGGGGGSSGGGGGGRRPAAGGGGSCRHPRFVTVKRLGWFGGVPRRCVRYRGCGGVGSRAGCRRVDYPGRARLDGGGLRRRGAGRRTLARLGCC